MSDRLTSANAVGKRAHLHEVRCLTVDRPFGVAAVTLLGAEALIFSADASRAS